MLDTFDVPNPTNSSSYPAPGPPLLDNNETNILDDFFENPNNVDPSFLSVAQNYHPGAGGLFGGTNTLGWMDHGMNLPQSSEAQPPTGRSTSQPNPQRQGSISQRQAHQNSLPASEDVQEAARVLFNQNARYNNMATHYNGYTTGMSAGSHDLSQNNGYGYPPIPSPSTAPYNFNAGPGGNGLYGLNDLQSQYGASENHGEPMTALPGRVRAVDARGNPIRFGTDDNFRNNYAISSAREQGRNVTDGFSELFKVATQQQANLAKTHTAASELAESRKRSRPSEGEEPTGESEEYQSSEEENYRAKKRRKSGKLAEDEDDFDDGSNRKNGKRKPSTGQSKSRGQRQGSSPARKPKGSPTLTKAQRENLSEEQKRSNHIQSEQKRRNLIKQGFEDLNKLVPELRSGGFSKSNMLVETAKFMKRLTEENNEIKAQMRSLENG